MATWPMASWLLLYPILFSPRFHFFFYHDTYRVDDSGGVVRGEMMEKKVYGEAKGLTMVKFPGWGCRRT
ncbi:hypothetical protein TRIATDRAFT_256544 [Trichoderma atroviride IMI 206040]|uniref:Uncharacterized protein n=1 Tax=Hypocrea atroviridis (strain ATCC 20476 / IMI 206040) TaxID=452589 RepID=G9NRQ1_HYPAI|nr:uncharacterized protein TRIATDRAFT_256544 [Trichoderma atroviride IMI 206040]EHK46684.1 hypothetical protein TRIATDRAFT_256544 [Trichoderma atroviride IMI 206040]